jgi:hypothetical protein
MPIKINLFFRTYTKLKTGFVILQHTAGLPPAVTHSAVSSTAISVLPSAPITNQTHEKNILDLIDISIDGNCTMEYESKNG